MRSPLKALRPVAARYWHDLRTFHLRFYHPSKLARIARDHHIEYVRRRAWELSGHFVIGEGVFFNFHVAVVIQRWGQLAATLGDRVATAPGVLFVAASGPCYSNLREMEGFSRRFIKNAPITVGDDTWLGAHVVILPGVRIGKSCLIGAGSVVTRDVPDFAIVAGVPGRVVGDVRETSSGARLVDSENATPPKTRTGS